MAVIVLNLKAYKESTGAEGMKLCKIAESVAKGTDVGIIVAPQTADLMAIAGEVSIPVFAQAVDASDQGAFTGAVTLESIKSAGCMGTLINHSERRMKLFDINKLIEKAKALGLESLVCTATTAESRAVAALEPTYVAIEPPELIGSGISVSSAQPEIVENSVAEVKKIADVSVLCGAGISNGRDVSKAIELGADGVLLASAFVKAKDPRAVLEDMVKGAEKAKKK